MDSRGNKGKSKPGLTKDRESGLLGELKMNKTLKVQTSVRAHGSCRAISMWRASRLAGNVEAIF